MDRDYLGRFVKGSKVNLGRKMSAEKREKVKATFFKKGQLPWNAGEKGCFSEKTIKKMSEAHLKIDKYWMKGEKNHRWLGEKAGYAAKHLWLSHHSKNPEMCALCGKIGKFVNNRWNIHRANKDNSYRRKKGDYIPLCAKCHSWYDRNINIKSKFNLSLESEQHKNLGGKAVIAKLKL